ncbi:MAG: dihydroorotase family protein [Thaumarchaeota archaeon]|nr:dihydroorotase family protein [Nitrososphaerota archaeon]
MSSLNIVNGKLWTGSGFVDAGISIVDDWIAKIGKGPTLPKAERVLNAKGKFVFPGFVDVHTHLRDADYSYKEHFRSGTSAAVAGGFTTVLDMPNTSPPITNAQALKRRIRSAQGKIFCDVGFYGSTNSVEITRELANAGCIAFKAYLHKTINGVSFTSDEYIETLAMAAKKFHRVVCFHAEDRKYLGRTEPKTAKDHLLTHPPKAEVSAIAKLIKIAKKTGAKVHVCHLSTKDGLNLIKKAKRNTDITCEATPHHLLLTESLLTKLGGLAVVEPPLRSKEDVATIVKGIADGSVEIIATDHAPHSLKEKLGKNPRPGFPGLETAAGVLMTLVSKGIIPMGGIVSALTTNPARRFSLHAGKLAQGERANVTILDPQKKWKIDPSKFYSKAKYSPFDGMEVQGRIMATIVGGKVVFEDGQIISEPAGKVVLGKQIRS